MTENTLNFQDGASRTINWNVTDTPGVRYTVQPVQVSLGAELQGADLTGGQLLAPGGFATLTFLVVDWDTDTMANLAANNTRLTVKTAGLYAWHGGGYLNDTPAHQTGSVTVVLRKNGATLSNSGNTCGIAEFLHNTYWSTALLARLAVNDILTMAVQNDTPNNVFLQAWRMSAQRLAP